MSWAWVGVQAPRTHHPVNHPNFVQAGVLAQNQPIRIGEGPSSALTSCLIWTGSLNSLSFSFLLCEMRILIKLSSWTFHSRINRNEVLELCQTWYFTKGLQIQPSIDLWSSQLLTIIKQMLPVLICLGCHNKIPQAGWSKSQKLVFSWFWRLEFKI